MLKLYFVNSRQQRIEINWKSVKCIYGGL